MIYGIEDLYVKCYEENRFDENEDKVLIGFLNNDRSKLKDVITGQIVDTVCIQSLEDFVQYDLAIGYMTGHRASTASAYQKMLAEFINLQLSGASINEKNIERVKSILNREIKKNHKRELKSKEEKAKLSLSEEERDF